MTTRPELPPAYTVADLQKLTGLGRQKVKRMMREGTLPGIVDGRSYRCPRALWDAYCTGDWQPRQDTTVEPVSMIHRRQTGTKGTPPHEPDQT